MDVALGEGSNCTGTLREPAKSRSSGQLGGRGREAMVGGRAQGTPNTRLHGLLFILNVIGIGEGIQGQK